MVVDEECHGCGRPGEGVADQDGDHGPVEGDGDDHPGDPQHTDTQAGEQHGNPAVADSPQSSGVDLDQDVGEEHGHHKVENVQSVGDYRLVGGEQAENIHSEEIEHQGEEHIHYVKLYIVFICHFSFLFQDF